jgi:hypothetical protein
MKFNLTNNKLSTIPTTKSTFQTTKSKIEIYNFSYGEKKKPRVMNFETNTMNDKKCM